MKMHLNIAPKSHAIIILLIGTSQNFPFQFPVNQKKK